MRTDVLVLIVYPCLVFVKLPVGWLVGLAGGQFVGWSTRTNSCVGLSLTGSYSATKRWVSSLPRSSIRSWEKSRRRGGRERITLRAHTLVPGIGSLAVSTTTAPRPTSLKATVAVGQNMGRFCATQSRSAWRSYRRHVFQYPKSDRIPCSQKRSKWSR